MKPCIQGDTMADNTSTLKQIRELKKRVERQQEEIDGLRKLVQKIDAYLKGIRTQ